MKNKLEVGQKYIVIKDDYNHGTKVLRIVTVKELGIEGCFFDENDYFYDIESPLMELELITPKSKKVKKYKYSRETIVRDNFGDLEYDGWIGDKPYYFASSVREILRNELLAKQQPKDIEFEEIEEMANPDPQYVYDAHVYGLVDKINQLIRNQVKIINFIKGQK